MKTVRQTLTTVLLLTASLTLLAVGADAQRLRARDYIGVYQRQAPRGRGTVTILMEIMDRHQARTTISMPRGQTRTMGGQWNVSHGFLTVTSFGGRMGGTKTYILRGRNLELRGDSHIFFRKQ